MKLNLLSKLLCSHQWKELRIFDYYEYEDDKLPHKREILYLCEKCGKLKKMKFGG